VHLLSAIRKKLGGWRLVATCPSVLGFLMALEAARLYDWDLSMIDGCSAVDTAGPGSNATMTTLERNALAEAWHWQGMAVSHTLWDIDGFDEWLRTDLVLKACERHGLQMDIFCLAAQAHMAPRVLQCGLSLADPLVGIARSILTGCVCSTRWARAAVREPLSAADPLGKVITGVDVDDVNQLAAQRAANLNKTVAMEVGLVFVREVRSIGLASSPKSTVVANWAGLAESIAQGYARENVAVNYATQYDDLGMPVTGGWGHDAGCPIRAAGWPRPRSER